MIDSKDGQQISGVVMIASSDLKNQTQIDQIKRLLAHPIFENSHNKTTKNDFHNSVSAGLDRINQQLKDAEARLK